MLPVRERDAESFIEQADFKDVEMAKLKKQSEEYLAEIHRNAFTIANLQKYIDDQHRESQRDE